MNITQSAMEHSAGAKETDRLAAQWLVMHERGEMTDLDHQAFDAWMADSLAHRVAYWRLNSVWERSKRLAALRPAMTPNRLVRTGRRFDVPKRGLGFAAVVLALAAASTFFVHKPDAKVFVTGIGGHKVLKLADGSSIELNTDTSLRVSVTPQSRTVWLDKGEAYFRVKHDADHAFTVISGDRSVTDLGTEFSIRRDQKRLRVAVIQGRVLFDTIARAKTPTLLIEGETAVAAGDTLSVSRSPVRKLADDSAWRRGMLVFDQISLADAAAEFNRYNTKKLVIRDEKAARRTIGATFPIHDIDDFVDVAQEALKLRVERRGEIIVISGQ